MKLITAYIKPHKLSEVTLALHKVGDLTGMSVVDVRGFGRGKAKDIHHHVVDDLADFIPHVTSRLKYFVGMNWWIKLSQLFKMHLIQA